MALQNHFTPFGRFVVRTPLLPFEQILALGNEAEQASMKLRAWFQSPIIQEALWLASPDLYQACKQWLGHQQQDPTKVKRIAHAFLRYLLRMAYRPTPFGLLGTCAIGKLGNTTKIDLAPMTACKKHTRLDMQYLCALVQALNQHPSLREQLSYSPNSSLYRMGNEYRYMGYQYKNGNRVYQMMEAAYNPYLEKAIATAKGGALLRDITAALVNENVERKEAAVFVVALIDHQILVSQLEPTVTGADPLAQLLTVLNKVSPQTPTPAEEKVNISKIKEPALCALPIPQVVSILQNTQQALKHGDQGMGITEQHYLGIAAGLNKMEVPYTLNRLFQTDTIRPTQTCYVDATIPYKVLRGIEVLGRLQVSDPNTNFSQFKETFYKRYGDSTMPLASVLDPETGIGYLQHKTTASCSPLIDDIIIPQQQGEQTISWSERNDFLLEKYLDALANKRYTVELTQKELDHFPPLALNKLPNTLSVITTLLAHEGTQELPLVYIHGTAGASGAAILGRFCHADQEILALTKEITAKEAALNPEVIYAEVVHLPEDRIGNVILRPTLSAYEIPYLARSGRPLSKQIFLSDLWISVSPRKEILLWCPQLKKRIIPRLSTMHNFRQGNSLPVYHFLCDLQYEHHTRLSFSWGTLQEKYAFLPRVRFENIILYPATWQFKRKQYQPLIDAKGAERYQVVRQWKAFYAMPRYIALAASDRELLIDLDSPMCVDMFCDMLSKYPTIKLLEALHSPSNAVAQSPEGKFTNQVIFPFFKKDYATTQMPPPLQLKRNVSASAVQSTFTPGSEWMYYKIYCGVQTADSVLIHDISPLVRQLLDKKYIGQWFFIRYNDPDHHIRVRFHLLSTQHVAACIQKVYEVTHSMTSQGLIWKVQIDTYQREIERYGYESITLAEKLFFHDSTAVTSLLDQLADDEHLRFFYGAKAIDTFLDDFHYSLNQKLHLLAKLKTAFGAEFSMNATLRKQLSGKYREKRLALAEVLGNSNNHAQFTKIADILALRSTHSKPTLQKILDLHREDKLGVALGDFVSSCLHMLCNRLFKEQQRKHELVMYDFMFCYYRSQLARK